MVVDGYKDTEIGVIPVEWEIKYFEDLKLDVSDGNYSSKYPKQSDFIKQGIPFIRANNIKNMTVIHKEMRYISAEQHSELKKGHLKQGDVLITTRGDIGQIALVPDDFIDANINAQIVRIGVSKKINNKYLAYFLIQQKVQIIIKSLETGTALKQLPVKKLGLLPICIPPLKEQEKIANILSTADEKIDATQAQIQKAETLKKGLLQKLLSEGIGHSEFKDSELGKIPKSWEVVDLGKVANITKLAGYEFTEHFNYEAGGDIIALRALNVVNGKLNLDSVQRVSTTISNKLPRSKLYINDILMTYVGTLGEFAIIEENDKFHLAPNVAKITMNSQEVNISKYILYYLMSNNGQKQIKLLSTTTSQPAINMENIRKIKIPLPPLEEQKRIAEILSTADEKIEVLRAKKQMYETLKKGLLQKLLSGEIRTV